MQGLCPLSVGANATGDRAAEGAQAPGGDPKAQGSAKSPHKPTSSVP